MAHDDFSSEIVMERGSDTLLVDKKLWAEALLLAENYGWKPKKLRIAYLASQVEVSDEEASEIVLGLDRLFNKALQDPLQVYPLRADMGQLAELREFIRDGAFNIYSP